MSIRTEHPTIPGVTVEVTKELGKTTYVRTLQFDFSNVTAYVDGEDITVKFGGSSNHANILIDMIRDQQEWLKEQIFVIRGCV